MEKESMEAQNNIDVTVDFIVEAGKLMLISGAEIHRIEDTMERMGKALGLITVDSFATPTGIMVTVKGVEGSRTEVRRITGRSINLTSVNLINDLSRRLVAGDITGPQAWEQFEKIKATKNTYPTWAYLISAGVGSGAFSFLFGGTWREMVLALVVGVVIHGFLNKVQDLVLNRFLFEFTGGALVAGLTLIGHEISPMINIDKVIIGAIMTLVPGVAITNAIRDVIHEDLISGVARGLEALLSAMAIASGVALVLGFWLS